MPPPHVGACQYCADLLASFEKMRAILDAAPEESVSFAACPDVTTLSNYFYGESGGERGSAVAAHLKTCTECRQDLAFLARSQEPRERTAPAKRRLILMAVAAGALLATIIPYQLTKKVAPEEKLGFTPSSRYEALVQMPALDPAELLRESPKAHHPQLEQVLAAYEKGDYKKADEYATIVVNAVDDPSAEYLLGMAQYYEGKKTQAFRSMKVSERMEPQTPYRCWTMLQFGLMMGDRKTVEREARHASAEPDYKPRCQDVLARL